MESSCSTASFTASNSGFISVLCLQDVIPNIVPRMRAMQNNLKVLVLSIGKGLLNVNRCKSKMSILLPEHASAELLWIGHLAHTNHNDPLCHLTT